MMVLTKETLAGDLLQTLVPVRTSTGFRPSTPGITLREGHVQGYIGPRFYHVQTKQPITGTPGHTGTGEVRVVGRADTERASWQGRAGFSVTGGRGSRLSPSEQWKPLHRVRRRQRRTHRRPGTCAPVGGVTQRSRSRTQRHRDPTLPPPLPSFLPPVSILTLVFYLSPISR